MARDDFDDRGSAQGRPRENIPNYLVPAILVTLFCCLPGGIVAIVYAAQVNSKLSVGDVEGARKASDNAKLWSMISAGVGVVVIVIWVIISIAGAGAAAGGFGQ